MMAKEATLDGAKIAARDHQGQAQGIEGDPERGVKAIALFLDRVVLVAAIEGGQHPEDLGIGDVLFPPLAVVAADDVAVGLDLNDAVAHQFVAHAIKGHVQPLESPGDRSDLDGVPAVAEHGPHADAHGGGGVESLLAQDFFDAEYRLVHWRTPFSFIWAMKSAAQRRAVSASTS